MGGKFMLKKDLGELEVFIPVGIGGGGGLWTPASSPHDMNLLMVTCDMSGFYRSTDRGQSWTMLDTRVIRSNSPFRCLPVFDFKDPNLVYFASHGKTLVSHDAGEHWKPSSESVPWKGAVWEIALDPSGGPLVLVGLDNGAFRSEDRGKTWQGCEGLSGKVGGFFVVPSNLKENHVILAGNSNGLFRSENGGKTWSMQGKGLPAGEIQGLCGGTDKNGARVYVLIQDRVYKSDNLGQHWTVVEAQGLPEQGLQFIAMAQTNPKVLYVTDTGERWGVYKSVDEGKTFTNVFRGFPDDPTKNVDWGWLAYDTDYGWGGPAIGFSVNAKNPDQAFYTNTGELYQTDNGGKQWRQAFTKCVDNTPGKGKLWQSIGLEVTTVNQYTIDPYDPQRHYICYTDIGFALSTDAGQTWRHSVGGSPWGGNFYQLIPDPGQKGVFYAAAANHHDVPQWSQIEGPRSSGGVLISTDRCETWKAISKGFPDKKPCVSIAVDFKTPPEKRVIYASVFGEGVFKSTDGGQNWTKKSQGLGREGNCHVFSIRLYDDGSLYCLVTGKRNDHEFSVPGGLWVSRDGAETWIELTKNETIYWPTEFTLDPRDHKVILLSAGDVPKHQPSSGGLWKTTNGGVSWTHVMSKKDFHYPYGFYEFFIAKVMKKWDLNRDGSFVQAFEPVFHPTDPQKIYLSTWTHGLLVSSDGGKTFDEFKQVPFTRINRVTFDLETNTLYVCTYGGGVWKGKIAVSVQSVLPTHQEPIHYPPIQTCQGRRGNRCYGGE